jgi:hypothetical protein
LGTRASAGSDAMRSQIWTHQQFSFLSNKIFPPRGHPLLLSTTRDLPKSSHCERLSFQLCLFTLACSSPTETSTNSGWLSDQFFLLRNATTCTQYCTTGEGCLHSIFCSKLRETMINLGKQWREACVETWLGFPFLISQGWVIWSWRLENSLLWNGIATTVLPRLM